MKRTMPWSEQIDVISSDESSSSSDADDDIEEMTNDALDGLNLSFDTPLDHTLKEITPHGLVIKRAEMYQNYMRQLPMPPHHGSVIPFSSWVGLGKSIKQLYGQPLHYLTNVLLKQWDLQRLDNDGGQKPLDIIIHPCKAEASIWLVEEIHRRTSSHHHLAKLWLADPMHHMFVDSIFPQL